MPAFVAAETNAMPPAQRPHRSSQVVCTPPEFLAAVTAKFGPLGLDVASDVGNSVAGDCWTPTGDGLKQSWESPGLAWCNPPFGRIAHWVAKAHSERVLGNASLLLVPASVGSNWWANDVHHHAQVWFLSPRLTFVGHTNPYPKDLALLHYDFGIPGYATWRWK